MGVQGPGVGLQRPRHQVPEGGAGGGPQPERAVDVQPRAVLPRCVRDLRKRVERARTDVSSLGAHDRRPCEGGECLAQRSGAHASLFVCGHPRRARAAQSQQAQGSGDSDVRLLADHHVNRRRAHQPAFFDLPPDARKHLMARGCERGKVRHHRACYESYAARCGQAQEIQQP